MKHHRRAIRIWLASALSTSASLALVSGASAMRDGTDWSTSGATRQSPVVSDPSSFNWGIVAIAATVILVAVLVAITVARVGRNRISVAPSH